MRNLSAGFIAELTADNCRPFFLFEIETASSTLRYSSLKYDITHFGETWLGNGFLKKVDDTKESKDLGADGVKIELTGEPSALISVALSDVRQNKPATIYLGFLDSSLAVIADPFELYKGIVDKVTIIDQPDKSTIQIDLENSLIILEKAAGLRYNHETQQGMQEGVFAGDLGFEYVEQLEDWSGYWGKNRRGKNRKRRRRNKP